MSREDIIAVASRLFAVFLLLFTLKTVAGGYFAADLQGQGSGFLLRVSVFVLAALAIAALLWFFPLAVAHKLLPVMREPRPLVNAGSTVALELGLTLIGFWVLAFGLVDLSYWIVLLAYSGTADFSLYLVAPEQKASAAATIVELAIAVGLILGSRGISRLVYRIRYGASS